MISAGLPPSAADTASRIAAIQARIDATMSSAHGAAARDASRSEISRSPGAHVAVGTLASAAGGAPGPSGARTDGRTPPATASSGPAYPPAGVFSGSGASPGELAGRLPTAGRAWAPAITDAANRHGVDPALLAALVQHESGFDPDVRSHAGAIGLAQLMPGTAAGLGVDPTDPLENLDGGARYLRQQLDRFNDVELALAAYNAGPSRVTAAGGVPRITETQNYVARVTSTWQELQ